MHRRKRSARVAIIYSIIMPASSLNETLWNVPWLLQLDPRELHHLAPFLGFVGDEFPEFSGGHKCRLEAHVEEAHLHRGSATIALISLLSRSTMLVGVFFGAPIPCQPLAS